MANPHFSYCSTCTISLSLTALSIDKHFIYLRGEQKPQEAYDMRLHTARTFTLSLTQSLNLNHENTPKIPLQLLLLHQLRHDGPHQSFVHHGPQDEISKDAHRPKPACAEGQREGKGGRKTMWGATDVALGPSFLPHPSGSPFNSG